MNRRPVTSSTIRSVGHDGNTLEIEFKNGSVYHYPDVPAELFEELLAADSVGQFFGTRIRPAFAGTKVEG